LTLANSVAGAHGGLLADTVTITFPQCHINMQMIGVRRVNTRTRHGREPSACRSPDRVKDVSLFPAMVFAMGLYCVISVGSGVN